MNVNASARDGWNRTPPSEAERKGHSAVVAVLERAGATTVDEAEEEAEEEGAACDDCMSE